MTIETNIGYKKLLEEKVNSKILTDKKIAYYKRMQRLLNMRDLSREEKHPVKMIIDKIANSRSFLSFDKVEIPEIVKEYETFDLL